jgi:hypothetical protein
MTAACPCGQSEIAPFDTIEAEQFPSERSTRLTGRRGAAIRAVVVPDDEWFLQAHDHLLYSHEAFGEEMTDELGDHAFKRAAVALLMD